MPGEPPLERTDDLGTDDAVAVKLGGRRESRIEAVSGFLHREDANIIRSGGAQIGIQRLLQVVDRNGIGELEAGHLTERVHARVGAAGSRDNHVAAFDRRKRFFEHLLHGTRIRLPLEPGEVGAVVGDRDPDSAHDIGDWVIGDLAIGLRLSDW